MSIRACIVVIASVLVSAAGVPAAQAVAPDINEQYSYQETSHFRDCGLRLREDTVGGGHFLVFPIPESNGEAWLGHDNYWFRSVLTNRDTGEYVVVSGRGLFKEMNGTQIEGDIWEFTALEAGQPLVLRDSEGGVLLRLRGVVKYEATFDLLGDGMLGGVLLEANIVHVGGPDPDYEFHFCDVIGELLG